MFLNKIVKGENVGILFQVPQSHCVIIERFGKYARTVEAGLHFRCPSLNL